ncbi:MAG: hypothetical protein HRT35_07750 [Algicola sp.]|nr:hypothetical protein [Algicola sp.]
MKHLITIIIAIVCFGAGYFIGDNQKAEPAPVETVELSLPENQQQPQKTAPNDTISAQTRQKAQIMAKKMVADNKDATITKLSKQVSQLKAQLEFQAQQAEDDRLANIDSSSRQYNDESTANEPDPQRTTISKEEAQTLLPKPFSNVLAGSSGTLVKTYDKFSKETRDFNWALLMENNIKDFITMHELSSDVRLEAVNCKTDTCEIMGFELIDKSWAYVFNDMKRQDWWKFKGTHSSSRTSDEKSYFYILTSRKT